MKILVVDDSATHRKGAAILLKANDVKIVGTYEEAQNALLSEKFDVYLGDHMLPASKESLAREAYQFVGQQMPIGTILALLAMKKGVKYVAVLTETNHHKHPASAALDPLTWGGTFAIGDACVLFGQDGFFTYVDEAVGVEVSYEFLQTEEGKKKYPEKEWRDYEGLLRVKEWGRALNELLAGVKVED